MRLIKWLVRLLARCVRAVRYWTALKYSWRLSWIKAGWSV